MIRRILCLSLLVGCWLGLSPVAATHRVSAAELSDSQGNWTIERHLHQKHRFPWYDSENRTLKRVELPERPKLKAPKPAPPPKPARSWNLPNALLSVLSWIANHLQLIFWTLFFLIVAGFLTWFLLRIFRKQTKPEPIETSPMLQPAARRARVEDLPFALERPKDDLLGSARRCYEEGDFTEAVIYLFSYQLMQLDQHQWIRLVKGKTNRQYLREIAGQRRLLELFRDTLIRFEDVFFGGRGLGRTEFEPCWQRLGEFQKLVDRGAAATSGRLG